MTVLAHETWFLDQDFDPNWGFAGETTTLLMLAVALGLVLAVRFVSYVWWNGIDIPPVARLVPWMPFAIRIHLAVSLIGLLSMGDYLSPALDLETSVAGIALGAGMAVVAVAMVAGYRAREAALLLIALGPIGMLEFGLWPVCARLDVLGLALFIAITGPGAWSADAELRRARLPELPDMARGAWALKVCVGAALIVVAFQEKLANPDMALEFLRQKPDFNVANSLLGLDMSNLAFVRIAGVIEVAFGALLISGRMPQLCVLAPGIPFNATLWFFGTTELVGHLPVFGAMLVLVVFGSHPQLRDALGALSPGRAARLARSWDSVS